MLHFQIKKSINIYVLKREFIKYMQYSEVVVIWHDQKTNQKIISKLKNNAKYDFKMNEQLKRCFLNKFKKKNVYIRITFHFSKISINVSFKHVKTFSSFEKLFSIVVMKVKMMQNKTKIETIAKKKKVDKCKRIKKKIIAKHTCTNIKCFKYFKNMYYSEAKENWC